MSKQVFGVDMYHGQPTFDAQKMIKEGVSFVYHKCGEGFKKNGKFHKDDKHDQRRQLARAAGLLFGSYWFFRSNVSGQEQAEAFCTYLGAMQPGDLPPMMDFETDDETSFVVQLQRCKEFLDYVEQRTGFKCVMYIGNNRMNVYKGKWPSWMTAYPLCAVTYIKDETDMNDVKPNLGPWKSWAFWQQNDHAKTKGVSAGGDYDVFNGTYEQLKSMTKGYKAPTTPPPLQPPVIVSNRTARQLNVINAMATVGYPKRAKYATAFWAEHYPESNPKNWAFVDLSLKDTHPRFMLVNADDPSTVDLFLSAHGVGSDPDNDDDVDSVGNVEGSKKSSVGMFRCGELSHMSDGRPCVRLDGLEPTNSNARRRAILIHPASYVSESKDTAGRTWGCFGVDPKVYDKIAQAVRDGSPLYCFMGEMK